MTLDYFDAGDPCPRHGTAHRKTYTFGSTLSAETYLSRCPGNFVTGWIHAADIVDEYASARKHLPTSAGLNGLRPVPPNSSLPTSTPNASALWW